MNIWGGDVRTQVECAGEESASSNLAFPSPGVLFRGDFRRKGMDSVKSRGTEGGGGVRLEQAV